MVILKTELLTIVIISMENDKIPQPIIIVRFRPIRSSASAGSVLPIGNISSTHPAISVALVAVMPTFSTSTVGM